MSAADSGFEKGDKAERLLNLTLALAATEIGLTKRDIFQAVREYAIEASTTGVTGALEKKFERDKEELCDYGVLIVLDDPDGDNKNGLYSLAKGTFDWPTNFSLSGRQVALLNLASAIWQQAAFSPEVARGLDRLRAHGDAADSSGLLSFAPRIKTHDPAFAPITKAINALNVIRFDYRKPGQSEITNREFEPWRISNLSGQWMVTGLDRSVDDVRNFLLKRIIGDVEFLKGQRFNAPSEDQLASAERDLNEHIERREARLEIKRHSVAQTHFNVADSGTSDFISHSFHYMDAWLLADELREFADQIKVNGPKELADAYRAGFEAVAADHA